MIKSFKSLLEAEIELGRVNVLIGANGCGKSNLLEAMGVLGAAASGQVDDEALQRRGVRPSIPELYKSSFAGKRIRNAIRLEAIGPGASYQVELNNSSSNAWLYKTEKLLQGERKLVGRSNASGQKLDSRRGLAALKAVEMDPASEGSRLLRTLSEYNIYAPDTNTLRGLNRDVAREPVGLSGSRLPEAVRDLIRLRTDPRFKQVSREALRLIGWANRLGCRHSSEAPLSPSIASAQNVLLFRDRFMAENRNQLTGYDASEGALYLLFATVLAVLPTSPRFLAIDNIDHGLNPRLARALMAHLCQWVLASPEPKQLVLTTHNPLILDGLPLDHDEIRLFAVGRSQKGHTTIRRIRVNLEDLQRDGQLWTVSRLWVMGHLGGVPDV